MVDAMSTTVVNVSESTSKSLDLKPQPDEVVTPEDAVDGFKLGRLLTRVLRELAAARRRFLPRRITYRGIPSTGSDLSAQRVRLVHNFSAPVEWWVVGLSGTGGAVTLPQISEGLDVNGHPASTANVLEIDVYFPGTLTIRVEESG